MSTFAKSTFNAARYMAVRPNYPRQLFDMVFRFHQTGSTSPAKTTPTTSVPAPRWERAIDLGCGTGQATAELTAFKHVIGVDPSEKMLSNAREYINQQTNQDQTNQFDFIQAQADSLNFIKDNTVDLVIAAQSCHWFDWNKQWAEMQRVLRPGGTVALWGYAEFRVAHHPELAPLVAHYSSGTDRSTSLGEYWERPGRTIVEELLYPVPDPKPVEHWLPLQRVYFSGPHAPHLTPSLPVIMRKTYSWDDFLAWLRTWSSLHTYKELYPERKGDKSLEYEFMLKLKEGLAKAGRKEEDGIQVEWPLAVLLTKKIV